MASRFSRLVGIALLALAPAANAATCASGTLADYIGLGVVGCEVGSAHFSGFASLPTLPVGSTPIAATAISVTPLVSLTHPGFLFGLNAAASAGNVLSALIQFQAFSTSLSPFVGASAEIAGAAITGDGAVTMIEDLCLGGLFANPPSDCAGSPDTLLTLVDAFSSLTSASTTFPNSSPIDVVVNFIVDGGESGGAQLESGSVRFVTGALVPEPSTLALLSFPLLLLFARRRRDVSLSPRI